MALAYIILAHNKPEQLLRLAHVLATAENTVALHLDARASRRFHDRIRRGIAHHPRIVLVPSRPVAWGQFSLVAAQLVSIKRLLRDDVPRWSHVFLLSAQDFPLQPAATMERFFSSAPENSYLSWFDPHQLWPDAEHRIGRFYLDTPNAGKLLYAPAIGRRLRQALGFHAGVPFFPGLRRKMPTFFKWYGGSNHVTLSRAACEYLVTSKRASKIVRWLRHSLIPDESVYQSVLLNSPLRKRLINETLREIVFEEGKAHPKILTMKDWDRLASSPAFFARKFDAEVDEEIIERLEARVLGESDQKPAKLFTSEPKTEN